MQIHQLKRKNPNKKSRKVGRGGLRGKTSGRGHKGQKQHGGHGIRAEIRDQIKKLPKLRGRGKNSNKSIKLDNYPVNLSDIQLAFKTGETVSPITLQEKGLVSGLTLRKGDVKILARGDISIKVSVEGCLVSKTAIEKISKAGGSVA